MNHIDAALEIPFMGSRPNWQLPNTSVGSFSFDLNVAYLRKFYRSPIPEVAALMAARDAGEINPGTTFSQAGGDLIGQGSRPKWKGSASLTWSYQQFQVGAFTQYVGSVYDPDLIDDLGEYWSVDSQLTGNLYFQYSVRSGGKDRYRFRLGVRNFTNAKPPLSSNGYIGELYSPYARYWYVNTHLEF